VSFVKDLLGTVNNQNIIDLTAQCLFSTCSAKF